MRVRMVDSKTSIDVCQFDPDYLIITITDIYEYTPNWFERMLGKKAKVKETSRQYRSYQHKCEDWYSLPEFYLVPPHLNLKLDKIRARRLEFDKYIDAIEKHGSTTNKKQ
jgi:hypothetical protein